MNLSEYFVIQSRISSNIPLDFKRYLFDVINWSNRLIVITGARGTGKTTLVLQHFLENYDSAKECLYISADNPLVLSDGIYHIANEFFKYHGNKIIIDEVHKFPEWSTQIKALYDAFPNKQIIILGSSKLNILNQKGDLSRRAIIYNLKGLSFREFLHFKYGINLPKVSFENLLSSHVEIALSALNKDKSILKHFREYKKYGFYPMSKEYSNDEYITLLTNILDKVIYEDVPTLKSIKMRSQLNMKKLIAYLAVSTIPTIKISSICNELDISKETLYGFMDLLSRADLINVIKREKGSIRSMKNARIFLSNSNFYYAVSGDLWHHQTDMGNIREAFFVSQIKDLYTLYSSISVDYTIKINNKIFEIEIGEKNKSKKQIVNIENAYIFKDDYEVGNNNVIPLYLAGFLY